MASGTTCCRRSVKRSVLLENDTHIVMKHNSHSEYLDRFAGSATCEAYAVLYLKSEINPKIGWGSRYIHKQRFLKEWTGRISVLRIIDECREMGIHFEKKSKNMVGST